MEKRQRIGNILEMAVGAGAVTFLAYECTLFYWIGHFSYYGIPYEYVEVEPNMVLKFVGSLFIMMSVYILIAYLILLLIPAPKHKKSGRLIWLNILGLCVIGVDSYISGEFEVKKYIFLIILLVVSIALYVFLEKNVDELNSISEKKKKKRSFLETIPVSVFILGGFIVIFFTVQDMFFDIGIRDAKNQEEYMRIEGSENQLILEKCGDYFIVGEYDKDNKKFKESYQYISCDGLKIEKYIIDNK